MDICFVTGNENKLREAREIIGDIESLNIDLPEFQELNVEDVVVEKAKAAYAELQRPVIVEDVGFSVHAWNGFPGALVKWMTQTLGNEGIVQALSSFEDKRVTVEIAIGYFDGTESKVFSGKTEANIVAPRGTGFGFDPIVEPLGSEKTIGELTPEEKHAISMRGQAFRKLKEFLDS